MPKKWTKEKKEEALKIIFFRMSEGESLRGVLRSPGKHDLPVNSTFAEWIIGNASYAERYAHAKEQRADRIFEDMIQICDDTGEDVITLPNGKVVANYGVIHRDKLRVDTRKWFLSKMFPNKYGDKSAVDIDLKSNVIQYQNVSKKFPDAE